MPTKNLSPPSSPSLAAYRLHALTISKLSKSDHQSALKYAICAHEVDPTLPNLPLIINALKVLLSPPLDHYRTLLLPPFSSSSRIRSQFKSLSLTFRNPDLNFDGLNEAIRRIMESYRVLSDRELKKEFDDSLRRLDAEEDVVGDIVPLQVLIPKKGTVSKSKQNGKKKSNDDDYEEDDDENEEEDDDENEVEDADNRLESKEVKGRKRVAIADFDSEEEDYNSNNRLRSKRISVRKSYSDEEYEYQEEYNTEPRSSRKVKVGKEKTLAQMQMEIFNAKKRNKKTFIAVPDEEEDTSLMNVIDSDFYEFDNDRNEKSFVKGQIWAVYDGDDGMPRHYGLVEDVRTMNSFKVIIRWLEITRKSSKSLVLLDNFEHYDTCGTYRLGSKVDICCINMFSHLVQSERMGKEVYRIYPRKGSVWAFYRNVVEDEKEERVYDIVVCLTSYSEMYGLSVAYLEKVDGYKTIFKRKAIGLHAITWLEKVNGHMFSHQIPSRKLLGEEDENLPGECWELDPASLPSELLCISNGN